MMIDVFSDEELLRYSRHILLPQIDIEGQQKLKSAHVVVVGAGGLGCPVGLYLASAGVGKISIIDADKVELSNLQRQIAHSTASIGVNKAESLKRAMQALNPEASIAVYGQWLTDENVAEVFAGANVIADCCDNFKTRYLVNQYCAQQRIPLVSGAAIRGEGQLAVFNHYIDAPCYSCLYPEGVEEGETCAQAGVLAPLVGVIGSLQVVEVLKVLTQTVEEKTTLTLYDAFRGQFRQMQLRKDPSCKVCAAHSFE